MSEILIPFLLAHLRVDFCNSYFWVEFLNDLLLVASLSYLLVVGQAYTTVGDNKWLENWGNQIFAISQVLKQNRAKTQIDK